MSAFILVIFAGSTLAFAFLSVFAPGTNTQDDNQNNIPDISTRELTVFEFDAPLTSSEESAYQKQDVVILRFYYSNDCLACGDINIAVTELAQELEQRILLERINTDEYSTGKEAPLVELKGSSSKTLTEFDSLKAEVCGLYFSKPEGCAL